MSATNSPPALFRAYLDESEGPASTYVVDGFVGKAHVWIELEAKWLGCLPSNLSPFHATDCFTGQ